MCGSETQGGGVVCWCVVLVVVVGASSVLVGGGKREDSLFKRWVFSPGWNVDREIWVVLVWLCVGSLSWCGWS